jgi:monoamine oxidase
MKENLQIKFNAPVIKIDYPSSSGVTVTTKDGATFHAKTCIISTPPHVLKTKTISFNPPLPATKLYALECTQMNTVVKVFVKFSAICWPQRLNGLVVSDPDFYFPEIWFCDVQDRSEHREDGIGYATSIVTSKYAEKLLLLPEEEIYRRFVTQLDSIFSHLQPHHFENIISSGEMKFPKPSSVFLGGMMYIWSADTHPYVGGGWSSPRAGYPIDSGNVLAESIDDLLYFCGEATHQNSGGTVTAAFESGKRAAFQVSLRLVELR